MIPLLVAAVIAFAPIALDRADRVERREDRQEARQARRDASDGPTLLQRIGGLLTKTERLAFAPLETLDLAWQLLWTVRAAIAVAALWLLVNLFRRPAELD